MIMGLRIVRSLVFIVLVVGFSFPLFAAIPQSERDALIDLYTATNGDSWLYKTNWKTSGNFSDAGTEHTWYGITVASVDGEDHVTEIRLSTNNLEGTLPTSLANLSHLKILYLHTNKLSGTIPVQLMSIPSLERLGLSSNSLTGEIPATVGNLTNLIELYLSSNQLTGTIPVSLGQLGSLEYLYLPGNQLTGTIPVELSFCTALKELALSNNVLSGSIPAELSALTELRILHLSQNTLTGAIPTSLGDLTKLTTLALRSNQLTGTIPVELSNCTALESLHLYSNALTGTIPDSLGALVNLKELFLRNNQLSGTIPDALCALPKLEKLSVSNNQLIGLVPAAVKNLTRLTFLDMGYNGLYTNDGTVDAFLESKEAGWASTQTVTPANISATSTHNSLTITWTPIQYKEDTGYYSVEYGTVSGVYTHTAQTEDKQDASLTITGLQQDTEYFFRVTTFTDAHGAQQNAITSVASSEMIGYTQGLSIPLPETERAALLALYTALNGDTWLDAGNWKNSDGQFNAPGTEYYWHGVTVEEVDGVAHVVGLNLSGNNCIGSLPDAIGDLPYLQSLNLAQNTITGTLPGTLSSLTQVEEVYLAHNQFSGSIPVVLGFLTTLIRLDISYNDFTGTIPVEICALTSLTDLRLSNNQLQGSIPTHIGALTGLYRLDLSHNELSGSIPAQLQALTGLQFLSLQHNQLSGTLPPELFSLGNLLELDISANQFSGALSSSIGQLYKLQKFSCAYNALKGALPVTLTALTSITELDIGYNALGTTDTVLRAYLSTHNADWESTQTLPPTGVSARTRTKNVVTVTWTPSGYRPDTGVYRIRYGTTPGEYTGAVTTSDMNVNSWNVIGLQAGTLYYFAIEAETPAHDDQASTLTSVMSNETTATTYLETDALPSAERDALVDLYTSTNGEGWTHSDGWTTAPMTMNESGTEGLWYGVTVEKLDDGLHVTELRLSDNALSGALPAQFGAITKSSHIDLSGNALTGTIPSSIGQMTSVQSLQLSRNNFQGALPSELYTCTALTSLDISNNAFTGVLAESITNLTALTALNLSYNGLYAANEATTTFVNALQPAWSSTQTIAPKDVYARINADATMTVQWTPITYQSDAGYYRVRYGTEPGVYTSTAQTTTKTDSSITIADIDPVTAYYVVVDTLTSPHDAQKNTVTGTGTVEIAAAFLRITAPTEGIEHITGTALTITWQDNIDEPVTIELLKNGVLSSVIAESAESNGSYEWDVPDTLVYGTDYTIRIKGTADTALVRVSPVFTLKPQTPDPVVLYSPADTATGRPINLVLRWDPSARASTYTLEVSTLSDFSSDVVQHTAIADTAKVITGLQNLTVYYWRVKAVNAGGETAWSEIWSFTTAEKYMAVYSPLGGEEWHHGTTQGIVWDNNITGNVTIELYRDTTLVEVLAASTENDGFMEWIIPDTLPIGSGYSIKVTGVDEPSVSGESLEPFSILPIPPPTVTLLLPVDEATNVAIAPSLSWNAAERAVTYTLEISTLSDFSENTATIDNITATNQIATGLSYLTTYYWRVKAHNTGGSSEWSEPFSLTTIIEKPTQVTLTAPTHEAVKVPLNTALSWEAAEHAATYTVQYGTSADLSSGSTMIQDITETMYSPSGLLNDTIYYWRVKAVNVGGEGQWSVIRAFTTIVALPAVVQLSSPINYATGIAAQPTLSWNAAARAATYEVQLSTAMDFSSNVATYTGITGVSKLVDPLNYLTTYYWRVRAVNDAGNGSWSETRRFTTAMQVPGTLTLVAPTHGATGQAIVTTLSWNAVSGAQSYHLQYATDDQFTQNMQSYETLTQTQQQITLSYGTTYYWRARAVNAGGAGAWSQVWSFSTIHQAPGVVQLLAPADNATGVALPALVTWEAVSGAQHYRLEVSTVSDFSGSPSVFADITDTEYSLTDLTHATGYYWRVRASNTGGNGSWSSVRYFTTAVAVPDTVTLVSPTHNAQQVSVNPTLTWLAADRAETYTVEVASDETMSSDLQTYTEIIQLSKLVLGLTANTFYYWRVRAVNTTGSGIWSEVRMFRTASSVEAPTQCVVAYDKTTGKITVSWTDQSTNETGFRIYRKINSGDFTEVAQTAADVVAWQDTPAGTGLYTYKVCAMNVLGDSAFTNESSAAVISVYAKLIPNPVLQGYVKAYINVQGCAVQASDIVLSINNGATAYTTAMIGTSGLVFQSTQEFNNMYFTTGSYTIVVRYKGQEYSSLSLAIAPLNANYQMRFDAYDINVRSTTQGMATFVHDFDVQPVQNGAALRPIMIIGPENKSFDMQIKNPYGQYGVLMRFNNGKWTIVDSACDSFRVRESGTYSIVRDANHMLVPKIRTSELAQNYPNPFNPSTTIGYTVADPGPTMLTIYTAKGKQVVVLVNEYKETGKYTVLWDGKDASGRAMPSGVYYYNFRTNGKEFVKKMIMLK